MLTRDDFNLRGTKLFANLRDRWKARLQKSAPKGVVLNLQPDQILPFTRNEFLSWLWKEIGLQAILCPYCHAPIDVLSMQLDHKTPLNRGGGPHLDNLACICSPCNGSKSDFTHEEYSLLVEFMAGPGAHFRQRLEGVLRNGGMAKMMRFFPRKKSDKPPRKKAVQEPIYFSELGEF